MKKIIKSFISIFIFVFIFSINTIKSLQDITIPIAMATDNNYAYPTIVAMTSILENKNPETKIDFYIMLPGDFDHSLKDKIDSLKNKYDKCSINFIDMKDELKDLNTGWGKTATYYRLLLPAILNLDKVLYMDVDTITQKDLSDLFDVNVDGYYLAGCKDPGMYKSILPRAKTYLRQFGKQDCIENYVNAGVLLFNLKKMRNDGLADKLIKCVSSHKFEFYDQDTLNWVCHDKIKKIDNIYNNIPGFMTNDISSQVIIHYAGPKPWNYYNMEHANIWWNYAKLTGLEKEIKEKFPDKSKIKKNRQSKNCSAEKQKKIKKVA